MRVYDFQKDPAYVLARMLGRVIIACAACALAPLGMAADYRLNVTREDSDLYRADREQIFIRTKYCSEHAYGREITLDVVGNRGNLQFVDTKDECQVTAMLRKSGQAFGKVQIKVGLEEHDWYEIFGQNLLIHTPGCFITTMYEKAVLDVSSNGSGNLDVDGAVCTVMGVYSKL